MESQYHLNHYVINFDRNLDVIHSKLRSIEDPSLMDKIVREIELYQHPRNELKEYHYQIGLHGFLKHAIPTTEFELLRGSARPDIVVGNIAIEIKGPTRVQDLQTIADKIGRYLNQFDKLIIVLFNVLVPTKYLNDYLNGTKLYKDEVNDRIKFIINN